MELRIRGLLKTYPNGVQALKEWSSSLMTSLASLCFLEVKLVDEPVEDGCEEDGPRGQEH